MELTMLFKSLRESMKFLNDDHQYHVVKNLIFILGLHDEEEYEALVASKFTPENVFDYDRAYMVLGKDVVDKWIEHGSFSDILLSMKNLDYLVTPEKRKQFYDQYNQQLHRTSSICIRLHKNFTLAEIEYSVNQRIKEVDKLIATCTV